MKKQDWLSYVNENKTNLLLLVSRFHPTSNQGHNLEITAETAEKVSAGFRAKIKNDLNYLVGKSASQLFEEAIISEDVDLINKILQETWIGVPESTECWGLTGFKECVNLLDDPIEE